MKKIQIALAGLLFAPGLVFSHDAITIPNPGTVPGGPFYFLDKLGENLQNLFTLNPAAKARLQLRLAAERVAEIDYLLDKKGVEAKEIRAAQARLITHLAKSNGILEKEASRGKDVKDLADELSEDTEVLEDATKETFQKQIDAQAARWGQLEADIPGMKEEGAFDEDIAKVEEEIDSVNKKIDALELEKEKQVEIVSDGEIVFYNMIDDQQKAEKRIRASEKEKSELSQTESRTGINGPQENKSRADDLLNQAKTEFDKSDFAAAARSALVAKNIFSVLNERIDDISKRLRSQSLGRSSLQEGADNRLAQNRIMQADQQRAAAIRISQRRGAALPEELLKAGDDLLAKARAELEARNDREAERFARGAKNIFKILKADISALDRIGEDFEAEVERLRVELEIKNRLDDRVRSPLK